MMVPFIQSFLFSTKSGGRIEVNKEVECDYIKSDKKYLLLFFGYFGCADVCTPLLYTLNNLYVSKEFEDLKEDVDVVFINLTPEVKEFLPDLFAKFFNKKFQGIYLSKNDILRIDRSFELFFARGLSDETELGHTDYVYLIENNLDSKILKNIYVTHPLKAKMLIDDITKIRMKKLRDIHEKNN